MTTENKLTYDIMELLRGNQISDDTDLDARQILYHVNNQRSLLLRNEYNKPGRSIDDNIVQDLGCLEMEMADPADCCDVASDCVVLRTVKMIPNTIELHNKTSLTRIGPIDKHATPFNIIPFNRVPYVGAGKYSGKSISAFILNNRIHIVSPNLPSLLMDKINVRGVFEDPTEASNFEDCDNKPCYTSDSKYPINSWMIPYIKESVLQQFGVAMQTPKDVSNTAEEDFKPKR